MPITIAEVADGAGIAFICHGDVACGDIIEAKESFLLPEPKPRSWMFGLFDLSDVKSADYSPEELRAIATADETLATITRKDLVVAIVAPQDLHFGLARMWQAFADAIRWQTMVFRNLDDAEAWIRKKVAEIFGSNLASFRGRSSSGLRIRIILRPPEPHPCKPDRCEPDGHTCYNPRLRTVR